MDTNEMGQKKAEVSEMFLRAIGTGGKLLIGAAALGGYLVAKHAPAIKKYADETIKDAIKCGLTVQDEVSRWAARTQEVWEAYVAEAKAEMAKEMESPQAPASTE